MKFNLDTECIENIRLNFSSDAYNDDLSAVIQDFCFGLASFFTDFALKIDCDTEQAMGLKDVCLSCIERNIDYILGRGVLEPDVTAGVSQEELDDFSERMRAKGFSESEIAAIKQLVIDSGDWGAALRYLKSIAGGFEVQP